VLPPRVLELLALEHLEIARAVRTGVAIDAVFPPRGRSASFSG